MDDDKLYVSHILEAIEKINRFVLPLDFQGFIKDDLVQSGVMRELGVIGEAAKNLSQEFKASHNNIPWKEITGMRDKLVHDYFEIDADALWITIREDLPVLKNEL